MKKLSLIVIITAVLIILTACSSQNIDSDIENHSEPEKTETVVTEAMEKIIVTIGDYTFEATPEKTKAAQELIEIIKENPLTVELSDYSGFEKVGSLGRSLTQSDKQTVTKSGDLVLYNGSSIVLFYGSNSWSYTKLARIDNPKDLKKALGDEDVKVTFSLN